MARVSERTSSAVGWLLDSIEISIRNPRPVPLLLEMAPRFDSLGEQVVEGP